MSHISNQPEQVVAAEAARPVYLDHWTNFASEQINLPNSPIKQREQARFRIQCAENNTKLDAAREAMIAEPSIHNVVDWYARLGGTSELEGAEPDLNLALSAILNSPEGVSRDDETMLLAGNLAHELGNLTKESEAEGFFTLASKAYGSVIARHDKDLSVPAVRQAMAHNYDAVFARLSAARRDGLIGQDDFNRQYFDRHREFIGLVHKLAVDSNLPHGELYEFYGEALVRHQLWSRERFGDVEVRHSFTPREDKPKDGFNHGNKEASADPLPSYAFDLKLTRVDGEEKPGFIQLKRAEQGVRYAEPFIHVSRYESDQPINKHIARMTEIMAKSYRFEESLGEDAELKAAYQQNALIGI